MLSRRLGDQLILPGLASAHSHAFQRTLRGHCQRQTSKLGSFWSWRGYMYAIAAKLDPDSMYAIARFAYAELAMAGVCAVGEFHYVHHQPNGQPYEQRTALADAVIQAANDVGIRIALLRVIYQRAGANQDLQAGQQRFVDGSLDASLRDIDDLRSAYKENPLVNIGLAIHSIRAVKRESISEASRYAKRLKLPMHMHLCEQTRELEESVAEHGTTPVQVMNDDGILDENFVAVHATHLSHDEIHSLGANQSFVCVCRTTERDLGDGHCEADALLRSGVRLCTGVDSYASSDPFEEARAIELDQRSLRQARTVVTDATTLLMAASENGYAAIGMPGLSEQDQVSLNTTDPSLVGLHDDRLDDAIVFGATPRAVNQVIVAGKSIVMDGLHSNYSQIRCEFDKTLARLNDTD